MSSGPKPGEKPVIIPASPGRAVRTPRRKPGEAVLPPEWRALLEASQEVEKDFLAEREKNQKLAREMTRIQFEKEILVSQVDQKEHELETARSRFSKQLSEQAGLAASASQRATEAERRAEIAARRLAEVERMTRERVAGIEATAHLKVMQAESKIQKLEESANARIAALETQLRSASSRIEVADPNLEAKMDQLLASMAAREAAAAREPSPSPERPAPAETQREPESSALAVRRQLQEERVRFRKIASALHREVEYLKQIYPIRGLLAAKQLEVERVKKALRRVSVHHPDRVLIEQIVQDHVSERKNIERMLHEMEQRLEDQCRQIQDAIAESQPDTEFSTETASSVAEEVLNELDAAPSASTRDPLEAALENHTPGQAKARKRSAPISSRIARPLG